MKITGELIIWHKKNKKWYLIREVVWGIREVAIKFDKTIPKDCTIKSITLYDTNEGHLKNHKFAFFPENKWCADIKLLDLNSIKPTPTPTKEDE